MTALENAIEVPSSSPPQNATRHRYPLTYPVWFQARYAWARRDGKDGLCADCGARSGLQLPVPELTTAEQTLPVATLSEPETAITR
jgi:hypothetical protein